MKTPNTPRNFKIVLMLCVAAFTLGSCGNDDDSSSIDESQLLTFFEEPYLNFGATQAVFTEDNGEADEVDGFSSNGYIHINYPAQTGVESYAYIFFPEIINPSDEFLSQSIVHLNPNQPNLTLVLNFLTERYGVPQFYMASDDGSDFYEFITDTNFSLSIVFSRDLNRENAILFVSYTFSE